MMAATSEYVDAAAAVAAEEGEALMVVDIWREAEERVTLWGSAEGGKGGGDLVFVVINVMLIFINRSN
jgi:hypothetical protein